LITVRPHLLPSGRRELLDPRRGENSIANLALISAETNKFISSKAPKEYMSGIAPDRLSEQWIPAELRLRSTDNLPQFLDARRQLLVEVLNEMLGLPPYRPGSFRQEQDEVQEDESDLYAGPEPGDE
jgi:hypothetical protein